MVLILAHATFVLLRIAFTEQRRVSHRTALTAAAATVILVWGQYYFHRPYAHKMLTYALGRPLTFADRRHVDSLATQLRQQGDGLATLVRLIVLSDAFQTL